MKSCMSTATLAVLVNGSPTDFFEIEKGLRQSDLLSPLLFNICVNGLSCLLNHLLVSRRPCGIQIGVSLSLNHLQLVDDTLIFCENDPYQVDCITDILESFFLISGLKLNASKSQTIGCNVEEEEIQSVAAC